MEILKAVAKIGLAALTIILIARLLIAERDNYEFIWQVWKRFRLRMLIEVLVVILLTIAIGIVLWVLGLRFSWLSLIFSEGGNIVITPVRKGSESANILIRLMVPVFFLALIAAVPFMAKYEEETFRKGYNKWGRIIRQSVKFGLVHCLVGVPLGFGIALILPGFFYGWKYKRAYDSIIISKVFHFISLAEEEAVMISTTYHTMYNTVVVSILLVGALVAI